MDRTHAKVSASVSSEQYGISASAYHNLIKRRRLAAKRNAVSNDPATSWSTEAVRAWDRDAKSAHPPISPGCAHHAVHIYPDPFSTFLKADIAIR